MVTNKLLITVLVFVVFLSIYSCGFKKGNGVINTEYLGVKVIYIGKNTGLKEFGSVLNDWEKIHKAIYKYDPRDCVRDNLSIDSIRSFDKPYSKQSSDSKGKIFTLGTIYPCYKDESSSGPVWEISEVEGVYIVTGYSSIEE